MFNNECLGRLEYEATASAIVMAGIFLSFLFEYVGHRCILARTSDTGHGQENPCVGKNTGSSGDDSAAQSGLEIDPETSTAQTRGHTLPGLGHDHDHTLNDPTNPDTKLSVVVMEAGVLFHSILIGLTLVVAGDSFYRTLLAVIVFHQFFEGLALGTRIALLPAGPRSLSRVKLPMGFAFTLITPLGMAIGLGVIHTFNGNNQNTIIAIGTLDALSAGILVWVGVVDMWARDWVVQGGEMTGRPTGTGKICLGLFALVAGFVGMSVLGKWA